MTTDRAADEATTLRAVLDEHRATLVRKTAGLDAAQLDTTLPPSTMTLGGMLKHLTFVEDWWLPVTVLGESPRPPFDDVDWDADWDWEWHSARDDDPETLRTVLAAAVRRSDEVLDAVLAGPEGLDRLSVRVGRRDGRPTSLRWILVHLVQEYARHNGHADLIRESIDGETGE